NADCGAAGSVQGCTGVGTPYSCCTGAGTGTNCVFVCTGPAAPFACCTAAGKGSGGTCPASNVLGLKDTCGGIGGSGSGFNPVYYQIKNITITCLDTDNDGFLDVTAGMSWDNGTGNGHLCRSPLAAFPNTPSKCNLQSALKIPINVPKTIQVCKDLIPS